MYAVIKYITRSDLREEKFILVHGVLWEERQEARVAEDCGLQDDCEAACSGLGENTGSRLGYSLQVPTPTALDPLFPQPPQTKPTKNQTVKPISLGNISVLTTAPTCPACNGNVFLLRLGFRTC